MMKPNVEELINMLSSSDAKVRNKGYSSLWSLEENAEISPDQIVVFLERRDNLPLCRYALHALGRLKSKPTYKKIKAYFEDCNDLIMLMECINTFKALSDDSFVDATLLKLGYKKAIIGSKYKKHERLWEKQKSIRSFIMSGVLEYFETCLGENYTDLIEEIIRESKALTRWHALKVVMERTLMVDRDLIADVKDKDPRPLNRRQASLILEVVFGEEPDTDSEEPPESPLITGL